ncbi:endonuclease/exonuclease/phosphatase family protein [uncultured Nocardioides sp.]|uniref:endonuclease/exonuclease/phosphatase family protein n=1 Tax=uncultured Nocardioides sp. TaxID=198441 RepID=UPI0025DC3276|nr:endonuclease/exonuclease/phosphatase family protein [uncultured Nocardioides sp.]
MPRSSSLLVVLVLAAGALTVLTVPHAPASSTPVPGRVVVASANLHEGTLLAQRPDLADDTDLRRFAQRLAGLGAEAPDVVALQEVRGSLGRVVSLLNRHARDGATYAAVSRPGLSRQRGVCGDRAGRFTVVRDGALVVNTATTTVLQRGSIRTWGRWSPATRGLMRRADAGGCAEHPWAQVRVVHEGASRDAVVVGTHVGPRGHHLKIRAMGRLADRARAVAGADDLLVLAGDFNLPWCHRGPGSPSGTCRTAKGHDALLARGFGDALHATDADRGPSLRVDFVHTSGKVVVAAWDRCYRPGLAPGCPRRDRVFRSQREYAACHRRAVAHGRPGPGCGPGAYARYYSDHPVVTATVR